MGSVEPTTITGQLDGDLRLQIRHLVEAHDKGRSCIPGAIHGIFYSGSLEKDTLPESCCYLTAAFFGARDCKPLEYNSGVITGIEELLPVTQVVIEDENRYGDNRNVFSAIIYRYDDLNWSDEKVSEWLLSL